MSEEIKDLGYMNGWKEDPDEYTNCKKLKHEAIGKKIGNCDYYYTCNICKISYGMDSSD